MIGNKYTRWTVIQESTNHTNKNSNKHFLCRCDCGEVRTVSKSNLTSGGSRSCGCLKTDLIKKDLSGMVFGKLTVINEVGINKHNTFLWNCRCECGNEAVYSSNSLGVGDAKSCGCLKKEDLSNMKFGKLTVISQKGIEKNQVVWMCECDCGNKTTATTNELNSENKISCGCAKKNREVIRSERKRIITRANCHKRRSLIMNSSGTHTYNQIKELIVKQRNRCANCESSIKRYYEIDHISPLSKGGSNDILNIQLLCKSCNCKKNNIDPIIFAQRNGKLL